MRSAMSRTRFSARMLGAMLPRAMRRLPSSSMAGAEQPHRQQQQRDQRFHQREASCACGSCDRSLRAPRLRAARAVWLITMARGGATPCASQIVRVAGAGGAARPARSRGGRARRATPLPRAGRRGARESGRSRRLRGTRSTPLRGRVPAQAVAGRVAEAQRCRAGSTMELARVCCTPASSSSVALRTAPARRAPRMEGTARPARIATHREPETQLDEGDAPASFPLAHVRILLPVVFWSHASKRLYLRCFALLAGGRRVYSRPCQCRTSIRA